MNFIEIENGESYYCEVRLENPAITAESQDVADQPSTLGGVFSIKNGEIQIRLINFDKYFHVPDDVCLEARTETNWTVSFFETVPGGTGQFGHTNHVAYNQRIFANTALIGWNSWKKIDLVHRTEFCVSEANLLLRHWPTFQGLANSLLRDFPNHQAFDMPIPKGRLKLRYGVSGNMDSAYPRDVWPIVEMEFIEGISLSDLRDQTIEILQFLSAVACERLQSRKQTISRLTYDELLISLETGNHSDDYSIYYYESERERKNRTLKGNLSGAFALMYDDIELAAFTACIKAWFDRSSEWKGASSAMMQAFMLDDEISPTRLLNATKWIEATPGSKSKPAMNEDDILALSKLVNKNAIKLGYSTITGRIKNSLKQISNEQNSQRFARIVAELKNNYGPQIVGDDLADWVAEAFSWRGKVAHNPIINYTETDYERFSKSIHAAECFAYLMLLRDLPMTDAGKERIASSELVVAYRFNVKGQSPKDIK